MVDAAFGKFSEATDKSPQSPGVQYTPDLKARQNKKGQ
jgi:hypothetical protein